MSWAPFAVGSATRFEVVGAPAPAPGLEPVGDVRMVTPGLFAALGVPLRRGRLIEETDTAERPRVVVVNEAMVREFWPDRDPIGQQIRMEWGDTLTFGVVGVVADVRLRALDNKPRSTLYFPVDQLPNGFMTLMVRAKGGRGPSVAAIKAEIAALDGALPVAEVRSLEDVVARSLALPRFLLLLLSFFSGAAILLAAIGIYGVLSYSVGQRRPEVGVRMALGASPGDIRGLVLREGALLTGVGLLAGALGALALSRLLAGLLYEVSPSDPAAYVTVAAALGGVALLAAWVPARRAMRVDPVVALRME